MFDVCVSAHDAARGPLHLTTTVKGSVLHACRHHHKIEPASHGSNDPGNDSNTELSKEDIKGHKEELQNMQVCCKQQNSLAS